MFVYVAKLYIYDHLICTNTGDFRSLVERIDLKLYKKLNELFEENQIDLFSVNVNACLNKSFDCNENKKYINIILSDHFNHLKKKFF